MTPDTQPTAFGDLTQPPHVPTCVSNATMRQEAGHE